MQLADNFSRDYSILEAIDGVAGLKESHGDDPRSDHHRPDDAAHGWH